MESRVALGVFFAYSESKKNQEHEVPSSSKVDARNWPVSLSPSRSF